MKLKNLWEMIKSTAVEWDKDKCPRLGAALSYYTLFSLAPVLVIAIAIAGMLFGDEAARGQIVEQLRGLVGVEGAKAVQTMLENARHPSDSIIATIIGFVTLLVGATGAFVELQDSLNTIWDVMAKPGRGIMGLLKDRLLSFGIVIGVGFLLLVSLVLSAALTALGTYLGNSFAGSALIWQGVNQVISFGVITLLFAMIYKILPDVELDWKDVWIGACVTSVLFTIGKFLIGLYLGNSSIASTYGAAGSVVVLLVWVYYTSQILLFGAEFTQVYAERFGTRIKPSKNAVAVREASCDREAAEEIAEKAVEGGGKYDGPDDSKSPAGAKDPKGGKPDKTMRAGADSNSADDNAKGNGAVGASAGNGASGAAEIDVPEYAKRL
ncbi:MAG: ribonuclease [Chlorobi bacterium]|nr:ribonuclease [Chlorobiota bacterium]